MNATCHRFMHSYIEIFLALRMVELEMVFFAEAAAGGIGGGACGFTIFRILNYRVIG